MVPEADLAIELCIESAPQLSSKWRCLGRPMCTQQAYQEFAAAGVLYRLGVGIIWLVAHGLDQVFGSVPRL